MGWIATFANSYLLLLVYIAHMVLWNVWCVYSHELKILKKFQSVYQI